ncbi:MAG: hypothetical protein HUU25_09935 [Candidatus Sumerlaeia bacterium]|nr:hypothetical protein [Candidatus Sumerlaeia bacterium]
MGLFSRPTPPLSDSDRERLLHRMVESQIEARGIRDSRVLAALRAVPRDLFVPPSERDEAFDDHPLALAHGQTVSQPYIVALMLEQLQLTGSERVLEIGTGSGYQTALLARLASEVISVERIPALALAAQERLRAMGIDNLQVHIGDGTLGWPEAAPHAGIIVTAFISPSAVSGSASGRNTSKDNCGRRLP